LFHLDRSRQVGFEDAEEVPEGGKQEEGADAEDGPRSCYTMSLSRIMFGMKRSSSSMETTVQQRKVSAATQQEPDDEQPTPPIPSDTSPDEFYAEITKRADVRAILEKLAAV
jgi:hypothetical protein